MAVNSGYFSVGGFAFPWITSPAESDVRQGTEYGAMGDEFTGTLYVPSAGSSGVDLLASLIAIVRQIPDKVTVNYYARSSGDTYGDAVEFEARRQPITSGDISGYSRRPCRWQLYATQGQSTKPLRLGKIIHDGITYHIEQVQSRWNDDTYGTLIHDCDCVQVVA